MDGHADIVKLLRAAGRNIRQRTSPLGKRFGLSTWRVSRSHNDQVNRASIALESMEAGQIVVQRRLTSRYPTQTRALRNIRIHGDCSPQPSGCHDCCTVRNERSACGISTVKRPSGVVTEVMPCGEPFGLYG